MYGASELYKSNPTLIETLATALDVPATISDIKIAVYKHAKSGVWIVFDTDGCVIGVDVLDGGYSEWIDDGPLLLDHFWAAITNCDTYASE